MFGVVVLSPSDNSYVFFYFFWIVFRALVTVLVEAAGFVEIREVVLRASLGDW